MGKKKAFAVLVIAFVMLSLLPAGLFGTTADLVYVIPVKDMIDPGQAKFVERNIKEAEKMEASLILFEIDTPGGLLDSAKIIRDEIRQTKLPTAALVTGGAVSAGALITISCQTIAMEPGTVMGAAEPRLGTERADEKYVSYFSGLMSTTAEANGRDSAIAVAMVDRDAEVPGLVEKGKLLTLTNNQAEEYGYADYIVRDRQELLTALDFGDARVYEAKVSTADKAARFITNPYVAPVLLTLGIAGIVIEIFTLGWGVAGTVGLLALALYFGGNLIVGFSGWWVILLFLLGIILLCVEMFIPGFGLPGITGILSIAASIILAAPSLEAGLFSLVLAIIGTIVLVSLSFKVLTRRKFWNRLVLGTRFNKEDGYIPRTKDLTVYIGRRGTAYTTLRPSGTVVLEDGTRLDVVTDGEFIQKGDPIEVAGAEGIRVIVRKTAN